MLLNPNKGRDIWCSSVVDPSGSLLSKSILEVKEEHARVRREHEDEAEDAETKARSGVQTSVDSSGSSASVLFDLFEITEARESREED